MFGSAILEAAIGLIFIYTLLSLACSGIVELIARVFNLRGGMLKGAIEQLVFAGEGNGQDLVDLLLNHGLIKPMVKKSRVPRQGMPSYLASRTFALALLKQLV